MARGTMYELQREKDFLNQLQEEELYEHLPDIAEFVKTEKNKEGAVCILLEEMQELGAVVGKEDDIPYIIFTKECKENYFRDRFAKVKKMVADMDLDEFSNSDLFTLRDAIQDDWGNMVYEDSMMPFDQLSGHQSLIQNITSEISFICIRRRKKYEMVIKDLLFLGR